MPAQLLAHPVAEDQSSPCVHELVAARARQHPGDLAVTGPDGAMTYGQLDLRSDRLARRLTGLGAGPGALVGLCMERSAALVLAALGILKSGAAYVALDPAYPDARLEFMLRDAKASVVITPERTARRVRDLPLVAIDVDDLMRSTDSVQPSVTPGASARPGDLAYVVYTSGSTGTAKGVMIEHRSLLALVDWHLRAFAVSPSDRATQLASPGFDAAIWELWPYLVAGASIHVPEQAVRDDVATLTEWLVDQGITITFLPTPLAETALNVDWPSETRLRFLLTGGDRLSRHPRTGLPFVLVNNYGPTEGAVVATSGRVLPAQTARRPPSIGRPIDHVRAYVVDAQLRPVPPGTAGELLIGGPGVARGYLNRPQLTDERFIQDPFSPKGGRVYRTGDLVLWEGGDLEFLGRLDEQIKIRGVRVEPGEVTAALAAHPDVAASFVMAREQTSVERQLVAYVVPAGRRPNPDELRSHLLAQLPEQMVPAMFVYMDRLPLTDNGKVDRAALAAPEDAGGPDDPDLAPPSTELERELAAMVAGVLGLERIGVDQNFFMLGGHSLLAAQLVAAIRERFGVDMRLHSLFDAGTVTGLADRVNGLIMEELEAMTDEEAERLAASPSTTGAGAPP
ncbi:MAG: non-ribosomal peptide synthetase [Candidatus Dormibacteraeota bacterium]|nr:non-ribosomal peptide synthetase [Candidatus Dormibacteraeota bacterium]